MGNGLIYDRNLKEDNIFLSIKRSIIGNKNIIDDIKESNTSLREKK